MSPVSTLPIPCCLLPKKYYLCRRLKKFVVFIKLLRQKDKFENSFIKNVFMKKLFVLTMALICAMTVFAQQKGDLNLNDPIKADPNVTIGKLDNGLTYYIRKKDRKSTRLNSSH